MQLREMIDKYPQQYIAVAYTKKGIDNLIETATVLKVYPTLLDAYDNLSEIKAYKKRYSDFDIVYGDYEDYVSTRRKVVMTKTDERLTQEEIDKLLAMIDHSRNTDDLQAEIATEKSAICIFMRDYVRGEKGK